jgi:NADH-quinone oxidoreductase subunit C
LLENLELWQRQVFALKEAFGEVIQEVRMPREFPVDMPVVYVEKKSLIEVLYFLKEQEHFRYGFLSDLTATDEQEEAYSWRFEVVYHLFSQISKARIRVKVRVAEEELVPTSVSVWAGANWAEREVYDMFGIVFDGHPDLRRILMDQRWVGHPLRKDYGLKSFQIFTDSQPIDPSLLK